MTRLSIAYIIVLVIRSSISINIKLMTESQDYLRRYELFSKPNIVSTMCKVSRYSDMLYNTSGISEEVRQYIVKSSLFKMSDEEIYKIENELIKQDLYIKP